LNRILLLTKQFIVHINLILQQLSLS